MNASTERHLKSGRAGFLLAYAIPAVPALSAWLGSRSDHSNAWGYLPLAVLYLLVPALNALLARHAVERQGSPRRPYPAAYYLLLPRLAVPLQFAALYVAADYWNSEHLTGLGALAYLIAAGLFSALFAVNLAHELIHRPGRLDRVLGGILLSSVCFGTFKVVHLRVHHRFVATRDDFSTARRNQSLYGFWWQALTGNIREGLGHERARLAKTGTSPWRSELVVWYALSLAWLALSLALWGWGGGLFFVVQSLIAILKLEWTNYVQHYGVTRRCDASGRLEPVGPQHSWSQELCVTNLALLNLLRHGDHHAHPELPYQQFESDHAGPRYPCDMTFVYLIALFPPLFRRIAHPALDRVQPSVNSVIGSQSWSY